MSVETGTPSTPATPAAAAVAAPTATPTATPTSTPAPGVQAPAPPATVTIPVEQLQMFTSVQARLAQMEADQRQRDETARTAQIKLIADKDGIERALNEQREDARKQIAEANAARTVTEERAKRHAVKSELVTHLSGYNLVPDGLEQLTELFSKHLAVDPRGESFAVTGPNYQPVKDFVAERLGSNSFAHFVRASNPNGGTAGGHSSGAASTPTPSATATQEPPPKNFGEAIVRQMQQIAKEAPTDSRLNPSVAMGLNHRSMVRNA
jgi:hypothetical protein